MCKCQLNEFMYLDENGDNKCFYVYNPGYYCDRFYECFPCP
jgi:hypothetical protein